MAIPFRPTTLLIRTIFKARLDCEPWRISKCCVDK
jgi:hypothetical protein